MKVPGLRSKFRMLRSQKIQGAGDFVRVLEPEGERWQILYRDSTGEDLVLKRARQQLQSHTLASGKGRSHQCPFPWGPS